MRKVRIILLICLIAAIAGGIYKYDYIVTYLKDLNKVDDQKYPASSIMISEEEANKIKDKTPIMLYFFEEGKNVNGQEIRYVPKNENGKDTDIEDLARVIIREIAKGPSLSSGLEKILPDDFSLNSVSFESGRLYIDINETLFLEDPEKVIAALNAIADSEMINTTVRNEPVTEVQYMINGDSMAEELQAIGMAEDGADDEAAADDLNGAYDSNDVDNLNDFSTDNLNDAYISY